MGLRRNVAVALGNSRDPRALEALNAAHAHDSAANDPLVNEHVEWARRKLSIDRD